MLAREMLQVSYHGVNAHAASNPWQGVNALDATVQGYTNVAMMRQQMKPSWRVHGVITDGIIDVRKVEPLARLGYLDYARIKPENVFSLSPPGGDNRYEKKKLRK